jgi:hypothetical protein
VVLEGNSESFGGKNGIYQMVDAILIPTGCANSRGRLWSACDVVPLFADAKAAEDGVEDFLDTDTAGEAGQRTRPFAPIIAGQKAKTDCPIAAVLMGTREQAPRLAG